MSDAEETDLNVKIYDSIMKFVADIKTDMYRGIGEIYNRVLDFVEELSNIFKLPPETWEMWEELRKHEGMLYYLPGYREHFIHQVHVFLLGYSIINKIGIDKIREKLFLSLKSKKIINARTTRMNILKIWFLTALFHDIGYAIEKTPDITDEFLKSSLGGRGRDENSHKATSTVNPNVILCWSNNRLHLRNIMKYFYGTNEKKHTLIDNALHDALTLHQDHGIFSALMLVNKLEGKNTDKELYIAALSIALHNKHVWRKIREDQIFEKISFDEYPIAFLLFYCDLVQEWGRYIKEEIKREYENPMFGGVEPDRGTQTHPPKKDIICRLIYKKIPEHTYLDNIFDPVLKHWSSGDTYIFGIYYYDNIRVPPKYFKFIY